MMDRMRQVGGGTEVMQLWDMLVFNVLCCNTDAHLKNHSLMLSAHGARLAPLYDVMCGAVWPNITRNLALDIGGKRDGTYIEGRHWAREAKAEHVNGHHQCATNSRNDGSDLLLFSGHSQTCFPILNRPMSIKPA